MFRLCRMFKPTTSVFSSLRCPKLEACQIPNCVFRHDSKRSISSDNTTTITSATNNESLVPTATKKQKITADSSATSSIVSNLTEGSSTCDIIVWSPSPLPGVGAPAKYQQRIRFIDALIKAYESNGTLLPKKTAVQKELEIATTSTNITYGPNMQMCIRNTRKNISSASQPAKNTKMLKDEEIYDAVKSLVHPTVKLLRSGYVLEIPKEVESSSRMETCSRCQQEFQLSDIKNKTKCQFHERKKYFRVNNRYWECCDQVIGETQGCKTAVYHVFKAKDGIDLHRLIPFVYTPAAKIQHTKKIIGLDCEMGYTTKGLELIRLTILDFYTGKSLFDEIIKPYGEVLDLNTQWSGVSDIPEDSMTLDELHSVLFDSLIDKDTIIIGHGLENDLNTLRFIHHNVVDTSILCPKGLDSKFSLKDLAFNLLDRVIQTGEHSSEEDSLAAIDIVKHHIFK